MFSHIEHVFDREDGKWTIVTTPMEEKEKLQYMALSKTASTISSAFFFFNTNPFVIFKRTFNIAIIILLLGCYLTDPNPI